MNERESENLDQTGPDKQQPAGQSPENFRPTGDSGGEQRGERWNEGSSATPEEKGSGGSSDTMAGQKTDQGSTSQQPAGQEHSANFVGSQRPDSGEYLRPGETGESETDIEGSSSRTPSDGE